MCNVYTDILRFFQAVIHTFSKNNGSTRSGPAVIGRLLWKPFDERFRDILEDLGYSERILKSELDLWHIRQAKYGRDAEVAEQQKAVEERRKADQACKRQEAEQYKIADMWNSSRNSEREVNSRNVRTWLNPFDFAQAYCDAIDIREDDTNQWI